MAVSGFPVPPVRDNLIEGNRYLLRETFTQLPALKAVLDTFTASVAAAEMVAAMVANKNFALLGTGAVTADPTFNAGGGFNLNTHGGATDSAILLPHLATSLSPWTATTWTPAQEPHFVLHVKTPSSITNCTYWAGFKLTNTPVSTTDDDEVFFRYQNGTDTNWQCVSDVANAGPTSTDSGVAVAAATDYRLWITVGSDAKATFWINGTPVHTTGALTSAAAFIPYVGVLSATNATVKSLVVRSLECSIKLR